MSENLKVGGLCLAAEKIQETVNRKWIETVNVNPKFTQLENENHIHIHIHVGFHTNHKPYTTLIESNLIMKLFGKQEIREGKILTWREREKCELC